jgi:hypothetical protein
MHRQFAAITSGRFDSQGSIVGPPVLATIDVYMSERRAESAVLIASTVLSND